MGKSKTEKIDSLGGTIIPEDKKKLATLQKDSQVYKQLKLSYKALRDKIKNKSL